MTGAESSPTRPGATKHWGVDLSGKCIVVTGGNRGIGLAISKQCAEAGAHVAIVYRNSQDAHDRAAEIEKEYGVTCKAFQADTADEKRMHELIKEVYTDVGPVAGIVCNAGVVVGKPALEFTKEDFNTTFDTNVWGVFASCQAAASLWKEHGYANGKIVIISSVSAIIANKGAQQSAYNASKGAVSMLTKGLASEWKDMGINVNAICPGYIATDMTSGLLSDPEKLKDIHARVPLGRAGEPNEVAGLAVFLLSDYSNYMTGTETVVDGGMVSWA